MGSCRTFWLRPFFAAVLASVLAMAGFGQGWASGSAGMVPTIDGVAVVICHTEKGHGPEPAHHDPHDCCTICAAFPLRPPWPSDVDRPDEARLEARPARLPAGEPVPQCGRSPKQAQGPPVLA